MFELLFFVRVIEVFPMEWNFFRLIKVFDLSRFRCMCIRFEYDFFGVCTKKKKKQNSYGVSSVSAAITSLFARSNPYPAPIRIYICGKTKIPENRRIPVESITIY